MAITENISNYVCDRCGQSEYLRKDDPKRSEWREIKRVTADAVETGRLLCPSCLKAYKTLVAKQDNEFNTFMSGEVD